MDVRSTRILAEAFPRFIEDQELRGHGIPWNEAREEGDSDLLRRTLDCSMINWLLSFLEDSESASFDSVRGMFQEAEPVFEGSKIHKKSHIPLAIRNPGCIIGYFRPVSMT